MDEQQQVQRGRDAQAIIDSPLWAEAWEAYRARLLQVIEATDSNNADTIMQAKRLLTAGTAARSYLERIMQDGAVSAATIALDEQHEKVEKRRRWWDRAA